MSRWSNPSNSSARFRVWDQGGDLYSHAELAANWDILDGILGSPTDGSVWPPLVERGVGKGIYKYLGLLNLERAPLGSFMFWYQPDPSILIPDGWVVANGQVLDNTQHDFPDLDTVNIPNIIDHFVIGADSAKAKGTIGPPGDGNAYAPGVVDWDGVNNVGSGGSNIHSHDHVESAHSHALNDHTHVVESHVHGHLHRHDIATPYTGMSRVNYGIFELSNSAVQNFIDVPDVWSAGDQYNAGDALPAAGTAGRPNSATGHFVPHVLHYHPVGGQDTTQALTLTGANKPNTDAAAPGTSGVAGGPRSTQEHAEHNTQIATLDNRPLHVGLIPLIKVKYATVLP